MTHTFMETAAAFVLALAALVFMPARAPAGPGDTQARKSPPRQKGEGTACGLPPFVEVDEAGPGGSTGNPPALDLRAPEKFETATFALG